MTTLPERFYLKRKAVLAVVGGRRELEKHERQKTLKRVYLRGYTCAHYIRSEVEAVQRKMHGIT